MLRWGQRRRSLYPPRQRRDGAAERGISSASRGGRQPVIPTPLPMQRGLQMPSHAREWGPVREQRAGHNTMLPSNRDVHEALAAHGAAGQRPARRQLVPPEPMLEVSARPSYGHVEVPPISFGSVLKPRLSPFAVVSAAARGGRGWPAPARRMGRASASSPTDPTTSNSAQKLICTADRSCLLPARESSLPTGSSCFTQWPLILLDLLRMNILVLSNQGILVLSNQGVSIPH